ncbi:MAG: transposase, partial [Candidatus Nitrosocosmicus sp.]
MKIHIATVDVKSKKILSMKITADEYVHDINALPGLVETITKSNSITVDKLFADDGTYDSNDIFKC